MDLERPLRQRVTRRDMLGLIGAAGAAVVAACGDGKGTGAPTSTATGAPVATAGVTSTPAASALSCIVSPEMTQGPYFVDEELNRSDITTDPSSGAVSAGVPLRLAMSVSRVNGDGSCTPVAGAHVDVWHCDGLGVYSDVAQNNSVGRKFLRGYQLTDERGRVEFATIYPGWYSGRTVHIHAKVRTDPASQQGYEFTSQLFFDEPATDAVYAQAPYNSRGPRDTTNAADSIYQGGGDQMLLRLTQEGDGYAGTIDIGMQV